MKLIKNIGLALFILALTIFVASLTLSNNTLTEDSENDYRMFPNTVDDYLFSLTKYSASGLLPGNSNWFFLLSFILATLGGLMYLLPDLNLIPGIKNNQIYDSPATRGITFQARMIFLGMTILASVIMIVFKYLLIGILTIVAGLFIIYKIQKTNKENKVSFAKTRKVTATKGLGWIGIFFPRIHYQLDFDA